VVQDYLAQMGGAERVTEALLETLPDADLFTTFAVPERISPGLRNAHPRTTWMQKLPGKASLYRHYFLLYPFAIESAKLDDYDLIVSSCCGYAKGVKRREGAVHVCYCHNPMRWVWRYNDYVKREKFGGLTKAALSLMIKGLKSWETRAASRPDYFIANSHVVADRLKTAFGIDAAVIEPPIMTRRFSLSQSVDDYYLILARLVPYKRIDLAVKACTQTGRRLVVIGDGSDRARLQAMAGPTVTFMGRQPDSVVNQYVSRCRALIFPGEEDFGMTPLEVNAAGRPVIAYGAGGATETIIPGANGLLFREQTTQSLIEALEDFEERSWDPVAIQRGAQRYDIRVFQQRLLNFLSRVSPVVEPATTRQREVA
jgi:glycosyltransferase involved in cell wall biosynthesis